MYYQYLDSVICKYSVGKLDFKLLYSICEGLVIVSTATMIRIVFKQI